MHEGRIFGSGESREKGGQEESERRRGRGRCWSWDRVKRMEGAVRVSGWIEEGDGAERVESGERRGWSELGEAKADWRMRE